MMKLLPLVVLLLATPAFGEIYTWTDGRGAVHYTNRTDEIPARYRARAKALNYGAEPGAGSGSPQPAQEAKPLERRAAEGTTENAAQQRTVVPPGDAGSNGVLQIKPEQRSRMNTKNRHNRPQPE